MKLSKFIFISLVLLSLFGCKKKEVEKVDELRFEKDVLKNVFVEIVDSIYMDRRIIAPPPPPRFDEKTNKVDTTGHAAKLKEYLRYTDSIKNDNKRILIGVGDLVQKTSDLEKEIIDKEFKNSEFAYEDDVKEFKLDLNPFKNNKKFNFKYLSKFPEMELWRLDDENNLFPVGTISVSRIQFNKTKSSGILTAIASCGSGKCGRGFLIIIENKSGKWKIKKIIHTWVS